MIKNLTPHPIKIMLIQTGESIEIPPEKVPARVSVKELEVEPQVLLTPGNYGTYIVPVIKQEFGEVEGLPEADKYTVLIVSSMVLSRVAKTMPGRAGVDVFAPDTGKTAIRDEKGNIVAVTRLSAGE